MNSFLETRGLVKDYPGVRAVDHVSLQFNEGEILGLVGKNGAGKSSVIKILAGASRPDEGEIVLDGASLTLDHPHEATIRGMSFVHQELSVVADLSVAENVELGLGYPRRGGLFVNFRKMHAKAAEVLERLGGGIDPRAPIGSLSVAEQRLVMIARALLTDARLVVLDEPSASLTDEEISHMFTVLKDLAAHKVSVVYVSHRLEEIFELVDRVAVMRDGALVADHPVSEFDVRTLIEEITGADASATANERRQSHGVGGPPDTEVALRVTGLNVTGKVSDVTFEIRKGEILGLAGLVGAGRTELVRAVFGADRRSSGHIEVNGVECQITEPRHALDAGIVLLPEDRRTQGLIRDFSVRRNVTIGTLRQHRHTSSLPLPSPLLEREAAKRAIESLDIKTASDQSPADWLSGGNQQKLILGRWLESGADVFIFDEPTKGIDVGAKQEVYMLMERLATEGRSVLFISSEFGELVGVCHRVMVLREGELVGEVSGDAISEAA
ncbi:MAG TPA: sugar ABC transporter ATP-binding protein, partial [Myxococcales bacterium]|nr:sugar ABC transporter ATP-binding protein [Myxococcales bacterium]